MDELSLKLSQFFAEQSLNQLTEIDEAFCQTIAILVKQCSDQGLPIIQFGAQN